MPYGFTESWAKLRANHLEWSGILDNFVTYFDDVTFNKFHSRHLEQEKLLQLRVASDLGLSIPETLLTNSPQTLCKLFAPDDIILVKPIGISNLPIVRQPGVVESFSPEVRTYTAGELVEFFAENQSAPVLVQNFIERPFDYRISVIGNEIIAAKISKPEGMVDSRNLGQNQVFEIVELPTKVCDALFAFMRNFDLSFGHFDFMCKEDGDLVFLECNPDGMWVFYDDGNRISDA